MNADAYTLADALREIETQERERARTDALEPVRELPALAGKAANPGD